MKRLFVRRPKQHPKVFPTGVVEIRNPPDSVMDVVFIHDISEPRNTAWASTTDPNDIWIKDLLQGEHTDMTARILVFGYDASHVRSLNDLLSIDFLAMNLAYESMLDNSEEGEPSNIEEGESSKNKEGKRAMGSRKIQINANRQARQGERIQTAFPFNTPHYPPGFTAWVLLSAWKLNIPTPSKTSKKHWSPGTQYHRNNGDFERMQRLFRRVTREVVPRSRRAFAAQHFVPNSGLSMSPDWISLPEDHMVATVGNDHFSMTQSTVDEDPDRVYEDLENNIYRNTSLHICEWAEIFIEESSDLGALVLQNIRSIKALLSMVNLGDGPSYFHVFRKGMHILRILQIIQGNPVTRSRIIQLHSRNEYRSKNNALRDALQDFQGDIAHTVGAADDAKQLLTVLLQRTSLKKLDQELDAIAPYLEWALNFFDWRRIKRDENPPFSVIRYHLDQFKHRGSLENMM